MTTRILQINKENRLVPERFICEHCNFKSRYKSNLDMHLKKLHGVK